MCGIAGYIHADSQRPVSAELLRTMLESIRHRGPDGEGMFLDRNVALGNRRLAVIDLETGNQPMYNDDKSIALVFNGEIYNYIEVREELKKFGCRFLTTSDTEVVVRAYEAWGDACLSKLNGMWAFALWDSKKQRLFCSRDRLGEKPFYYTVADGTLVFGSEIKTLFSWGVERVLDTELLDAYLCFTYLPAPYTMFRNIQKLPPGTSLLFEGGKVTTCQYWAPQFNREELSRNDEQRITDEFTHFFEDSVRLRMRSDVPFGAFLSGGLDSSSVVAAMSDYSQTPIKTFTVGFESVVEDERRLARLTAQTFNAEHTERIVTPENGTSLMRKIAWHFDEPFGDSSALPTYLLSKVARERVTVVLTGDGGDEVLGGYTIHQGEKFSKQLAFLPALLRESIMPSAIALAGAIAPPRMKGRLRRSATVVDAANMSFTDRLESKQEGFSREARAMLLGHLKGVRPAREFIEEVLSPLGTTDNFVRLNHWLTRVSLPDDMLCKVDRMSMAHSLEARVPFLDHRIVELLANVSMKVKLKGYQRKHILRRTVGRRLPTELLSAPKRGFHVPIDMWFGGKVEEWLHFRANNCASQGLVDGGALDFLFSANAHRESGNGAWALAMLSYSAT